MVRLLLQHKYSRVLQREGVLCFFCVYKCRQRKFDKERRGCRLGTNEKGLGLELLNT
ncbi:hypothetical protein Hanom_Chr01g00060081 [Helianthus anomalus]